MKTVYVGLSGGVDSAVAAALLQKEGYQVVGVYMKNWTRDLPGMACPWKEDIADARAVAAALEIPFKVYDFQSEYRQQVVDYMIAEYKTGRTPNPDIMCNQEIKFKLFLDRALVDGADFIATGHYATVNDGRLMRGIDENKDQTYFLYRVTQAALVKTIMPIGAFLKPQVRKIAKEFKLPVAYKKDSQGICFIGPVGMKAFLSQYVDTAAGNIMLVNGRILGRHNGAIFYTTGQRQGLGVGGGKPFYVIGKSMAKNEVYVTDDPDDLVLHTDQIILADNHWIDKLPVEGKVYQVRMRHRGLLIDCHISATPGVDKVNYPRGSVYLQLSKPVRAIAAGQSAVIYDGEVVMGGGIISATALNKPQRQKSVLPASTL